MVDGVFVARRRLRLALLVAAPRGVRDADALVELSRGTLDDRPTLRADRVGERDDEDLLRAMAIASLRPVCHAAWRCLPVPGTADRRH